MIRVAIYKSETGCISRVLDVGYMDVQPSLLEGEEFYLNCPDGATHIFNGEPTIVIPEKTIEQLLNIIRLQRNQLLSACDWTQVADATVDKTAWAIYRQALRDFPDTCNPENPIWPIQPA